MNIGTPELLLILFAVLLLFGGNKLPQLARGLGQGIREFKDASDGVKREIHRNINAVQDDLNVNSTSNVSGSTTDVNSTSTESSATADLNSTTEKTNSSEVNQA
ncbi:Sec-independent protein translocase subunit TatA/TatB [Rubrolithibacter danxiaensis]|uniref:Sec-independent protein translocase subunit TatA/TatB n=1 Tax=Rubrolithibacter danxiaensis TaxID=3390805 RepID=UPI003BF77276